jgi:drug/metabolite transporter (DMT)-like permease
MKEGLPVVLFLIALTSFCDTINQLFLKSAIDSLQFNATLNPVKIIKFIFQLIIRPRLWLGFLFSLVSLGIWLVVLSKADLNFAFSADSMHYIFIALACRFFLKEKTGPQRWAGTGLIILGITLVSFS